MDLEAREAESMYIETASAERPYPGNNHDRLVLLPEVGRFALFDGAGQALASDVAAEIFIEQHEQYKSSETTPLPFLNEVFQEIHTHIQKYQDEKVPPQFHRIKKSIITTGTAVGVRTLKDGRTTPILEYAHAGDSALWLFDHDANKLSKLTIDEVRGAVPSDTIPNVRNWLGASEHRLQQWAGIVLRSSRVTLALFSDGISSDEMPAGAVSAEAIQEILSNSARPQDKADRIVAASSVKDDASVIVVEAQT